MVNWINSWKSSNKKNKIDFVIVNAENADETGVGLTQKICEKILKSAK